MFLRVCFGCHVLEGYGMTETSCTITITRMDDPTIGHVGAPLSCCEIKLVDIPEMHYMTTDQPHPRCVTFDRPVKLVKLVKSVKLGV